MDLESAAIAAEAARASKAVKTERARVESLFEAAANRCAAAPDLDKKAFGDLVRKVKPRGGGTVYIAR
jgi:hypothetical protein